MTATCAKSPRKRYNASIPLETQAGQESVPFGPSPYPPDPLEAGYSVTIPCFMSLLLFVEVIFSTIAPLVNRTLTIWVSIVHFRLNKIDDGNEVPRGRPGRGRAVNEHLLPVRSKSGGQRLPDQLDNLSAVVLPSLICASLSWEMRVPTVAQPIGINAINISATRRLIRFPSFRAITSLRGFAAHRPLVAQNAPHARFPIFLSS